MIMIQKHYDVQSHAQPALELVDTNSLENEVRSHID